MKQLFIIILITILAGNISFAQITIRGTLTGGKEKEALFMANVFLNNTTRGTTSNDLGYFEIKNVPPGRYELIASYIGFEKYTEVLLLNTSGITELQINLKSKPHKIGNVIVQDEEDSEWRSNMKIFKREFLGTSENSDYCEIENPEYIELHVNKRNELVAKTDQPIVVKNRALGYEVSVLLNHFIYNNNSRVLSYSFNSQFKEMESNNIDQNEFWKEKRIETYKGSLTHFLKSVVDNKVTENGFHVQRLRGENYHYTSHPPLEVPRYYLDQIYRISDSVAQSVFLQLSDGNCEIKLDDDFLRILYMDEIEEVGYAQSYTTHYRTAAAKQKDYQSSLIKLPYESYYFDKRGGREDFQNRIKVFGYLSWLRIADIMPYDYLPIEE